MGLIGRMGPMGQIIPMSPIGLMSPIYHIGCIRLQVSQTSPTPTKASPQQQYHAKAHHFFSGTGFASDFFSTRPHIAPPWSPCCHVPT